VGWQVTIPVQPPPQPEPAASMAPSSSDVADGVADSDAEPADSDGAADGGVGVASPGADVASPGTDAGTSSTVRKARSRRFSLSDAQRANRSRDAAPRTRRMQRSDGEWHASCRIHPFLPLRSCHGRVCRGRSGRCRSLCAYGPLPIDRTSAGGTQSVAVSRLERTFRA
jgi:hypothetical protein